MYIFSFCKQLHYILNYLNFNCCNIKSFWLTLRTIFRNLTFTANVYERRIQTTFFPARRRELRNKALRGQETSTAKKGRHWFVSASYVKGAAPPHSTSRRVLQISYKSSSVRYFPLFPRGNEKYIFRWSNTALKFLQRLRNKVEGVWGREGDYSQIINLETMSMLIVG